MLTMRSSGISSSAPDAAFASAPVSSGALRSCAITIAAPKACAVRSSAPMLRGSEIWSSTSTGPGRFNASSSAGLASWSVSKAMP